MNNQQCREKIEKITVFVERQKMGAIRKKDSILKEIAEALREAGKENLVQQLQQIQYFIDDAMYIAIYQAAIEDANFIIKNKVEDKVTVEAVS